MPTAPVLAATSAGYPARTFALYLDGLDVLKQPGGSGYGVPIDSIRVVEAGPGAVGSMAFTIDDPTGLVSIAGLDRGPRVLYVDLVSNAVLHRGVVDTGGSRPAFGGQGRSIPVTSTAVDSLLDDRIVPPVTFVGGMLTWLAIAQATNIAASELRAPAFDLGGGSFPPASLTDGNFDWPIGFLQTDDGVGNAQLNGALAWSGGSLRACIEAIEAQSIYVGSSGWLRDRPPPAFLVTVDTYLGLRVWRDQAGAAPADWTTLTVSDTAGGPLRAANLQYDLAPGDVIRAVYVQGFDATSSLWVADGSGINGRQARIVDSSLTTADAATRAGLAYLAANSGKVRGTFDLEDFTPPASTIHAGGLLSLTDAAAAATGSYRIYSIAKSFNASGRQDWSVSFGGNPPSAMALARRLTRNLS